MNVHCSLSFIIVRDRWGSFRIVHILNIYIVTNRDYISESSVGRLMGKWINTKIIILRIFLWNFTPYYLFYFKHIYRDEREINISKLFLLIIELNVIFTVDAAKFLRKNMMTWLISMSVLFESEWLIIKITGNTRPIFWEKLASPNTVTSKLICYVEYRANG